MALACSHAGLQLHQKQTAMLARSTRARARLTAVPRSRGRLQVTALQIDRREAYVRMWKRLEERELALQSLGDLSLGSQGTIITVDDMQHCEMLLDKAGSCLVILFLSSRTCGVCKDARKRLESMCRDAAAAKARVVFMEAELQNEYDHYSDIAAWYKVKAVPTFLFIDEGAVVRRLSLRDVRRLTGTSDWVQGAMAADMRKLRDTFTEVLFKRAPSTRQ